MVEAPPEMLRAVGLIPGATATFTLDNNGWFIVSSISGKAGYTTAELVAEELVAQANMTEAEKAEIKAWHDAPPIGREVW